MKHWTSVEQCSGIGLGTASYRFCPFYPLKLQVSLARISHNQVENDVFHGMRGVRGMEGRVASLKRLRRAGMRVFSPPFFGRDGESLSIRARGGRRAPPPASCTRLHRAFTLVPGWPKSSGNPSSTGRRTRTPDGSAAWTPSRAPGSGTGTCAASMDGSGAGWRRDRKVLEPALHHAMKGMGQCAHPEPECVDVPKAAGASVQEQIVLLFLDPVFGLTPVTVHLYRRPLARRASGAR